MKCATSAFIAAVLLVEFAFGLEGGRKVYYPDEFPYLVNIQKNNESLCMGIIFDVTHVVFPGDCSRKTTLDVDSADVVPLVGHKKYEGHFVKTVTNPYKEQFPDMDIAIIKVEPPGIAVGLSNKNTGLPALAPLSINEWSGTGRSDAVVVGSNGRVGSLSFVDDNYCMEQLGKFDDGLIGEWFQTMKMLQGKRMVCAETTNTTKKIGDIPPGRVCQSDLGAPLIDDDGTVVGILVQAFCQRNIPRLSLYLKVAESDAHKLQNDFNEPIANNQIEKKPTHILLSDIESGLESVQLKDKLNVFGHLMGNSAYKRYRRKDAPPASAVPPAASASVPPPAGGNDTASASPAGGNATAGAPGGGNATAGAPGGGNTTGAAPSKVAGPGGNATGGGNATAGGTDAGNATGGAPSNVTGPGGNATAAGDAQQVGINATAQAFNGTGKGGADVKPSAAGESESEEEGDAKSEEKGSSEGEGSAMQSEEQIEASGSQEEKGEEGSGEEGSGEEGSGEEGSGEEQTEKAGSEVTEGDEASGGVSEEEGDEGSNSGENDKEPEYEESGDDYVENNATQEIVVPESGDGSVVEGWGEKEIADVHGSGEIPPTTTKTTAEELKKRLSGGGVGAVTDIAHHPHLTDTSDTAEGGDEEAQFEQPPEPTDDKPAKDKGKPAVRQAGSACTAVASLTTILLTVILTVVHTS